MIQKATTTARYLRSRQRETSPMMWSALFQQKPAPEDGDYFKADWIKTYDVEPDPKTLRIYGASDFAVTADGGDFTVHGVLGLDPDGQALPARSVAQAGIVRRVGGSAVRPDQEMEADGVGARKGPDHFRRRALSRPAPDASGAPIASRQRSRPAATRRSGRSPSAATSTATGFYVPGGRPGTRPCGREMLGFPPAAMTTSSTCWGCLVS